MSNLYKAKYRKNVNFKFRLPTETEWELAASNGLSKSKYKYGIEKMQTISYKVNAKAAEFLLDKILSKECRRNNQGHSRNRTY